MSFIISRDRGMVVFYERVNGRKRRIWSFVPGPDGSVPYHTAPACAWSDDQRRRLEHQARVVALAGASGAQARPARPPRTPRSARASAGEPAPAPSQPPIPPSTALPFPPAVSNPPAQRCSGDSSDATPIAVNMLLTQLVLLIQRWRTGLCAPAEARSVAACAHAIVRTCAADFGYIATESDAPSDDDAPIVVLPFPQPCPPSACA